MWDKAQKIFRSFADTAEAERCGILRSINIGVVSGYVTTAV